MNETELRIAKKIYERQLSVATTLYATALSNKYYIEMQLEGIQRMLDELEVTA